MSKTLLRHTSVATRHLLYFAYREKTKLWETKGLDDPNDREGSVRGKHCGYIWFSLQRIIISGENLHCHIISPRWGLLNLVPFTDLARFYNFSIGI